MPTNYDRKRRIGSIIRVSGTILPFVQIGNVFRLTTAVVNRASVSPLSDSLLAVTAPLGVVTSPIMSLIITTGLNTATTTSIASGSAAAANIDVFSYNGAVQFLSNVIIERDLVFTDTSSQIRAKVAIISGTLAGHTISTLGWVDGRGITA
jgi:hypothetical protein